MDPGDETRLRALYAAALAEIRSLYQIFSPSGDKRKMILFPFGFAGCATEARRPQAKNSPLEYFLLSLPFYAALKTNWWSHLRAVRPPVLLPSNSIVGFKTSSLNLACLCFSGKTRRCFLWTALIITSLAIAPQSLLYGPEFFLEPNFSRVKRSHGHIRLCNSVAC